MCVHAHVYVHVWVHASQLPMLCLLSDKVRVLVLTSALLVAAEAPQEALASWL